MRKLLSDRWTYCYSFLTALAVLAATVGMAAAQNTERPQLHTNEAYVEEVTRATTLAVNDPMAVFAFVLNSLPDRELLLLHFHSWWYAVCRKYQDRVGRQRQGYRAFCLLRGFV